MKIKSTAVTLLGLSLALAVSGTAMADQHSTNEEGKELKREYKKEKRKMRREKLAESMLLKVDSNKDGQVDLNEYLAHAQDRFNKLDANADGYVTTEEAQESMKAMRKEHKERRKNKRAKRNEESS